MPSYVCLSLKAQFTHERRPRLHSGHLGGRGGLSPSSATVAATRS